MAKEKSSKNAVKNMFENDTQALNISKSTTQEKIEKPLSIDTVEEIKSEPSAKKDKLIPRTIYLTKEQIKAIKLKTIESDLPEHKDISAVVRTALNQYLI